MKHKLALVLDFIYAVVSGYILASLSHTQFVLHGLAELGVDIGFNTRLETSFNDLIGLLPALGSTFLVALLLAFLVVAGLAKWQQRTVNFLYPIAGGLSIFIAYLAMHPILQVTLIAGARSDFGLLMQCFAGVFAGWVFMYQRGKSNS